MLNYLWAGMILVGIVYGAFNGKMPDITNAALDSAKEAVTLCITMIGGRDAVHHDDRRDVLLDGDHGDCVPRRDHRHGGEEDAASDPVFVPEDP